MKKKYFKKSQSSLQRKFIAGGLTATFAFGTVGSGFAGASENDKELIIADVENPEEELEIKKEEIHVSKIFFDQNKELIKDVSKNYKKWEKVIFGDAMKKKVMEMYNVSDESKFNEVWENFSNKRNFVISFLFV